MNAYQSEHGLTPGVYAAEGWDAGRLVAGAIVEGATDRADMRAALAATSAYRGRRAGATRSTPSASWTGRSRGSSPHPAPAGCRSRSEPRTAAVEHRRETRLPPVFVVQAEGTLLGTRCPWVPPGPIVRRGDASDSASLWKEAGCASSDSGRSSCSRPRCRSSRRPVAETTSRPSPQEADGGTAATGACADADTSAGDLLAQVCEDRRDQGLDRPRLPAAVVVEPRDGGVRRLRHRRRDRDRQQARRGDRVGRPRRGQRSPPATGRGAGT